MKKLFALLLALSLCFALVGCDNEELPEENNYLVFDLGMGTHLEEGAIIDAAKVKDDMWVIHYLSTKGEERILLTPLYFVKFGTNDEAYELATSLCDSMSKQDMLTIVREYELSQNLIGGFTFTLKQHPMPTE